jgi:hypothetical protein
MDLKNNIERVVQNLNNENIIELTTTFADSEYVKKYEKKAARRMEAVKEIEAKLQKKVNPPPPKPKTKYDGLSIF